LLRCPWHGYDYDPLTGVPPGDFADAVPAFAVEEREDGVWVELPDLPEYVRTVGDVVVETLVAWVVTQVFGMVGHSNLWVAEAMRRAEERGELRYIGIRHEGAASFAASGYAKLSGRPAACLAIAGPGSTNLLTGLTSHPWRQSGQTQAASSTDARVGSQTGLRRSTRERMGAPRLVPRALYWGWGGHAGWRQV
jgi:Thiamine pyrophosphate enzyme, N-terminal TPP binding domain